MEIILSFFFSFPEKKKGLINFMLKIFRKKKEQMRARIRWREKKKKGERGRTGKQGTWEILESQKKTNLHEKERKLSPSKHSFSSFFFPYTYIFLRLSFYSAFFFLFLIISLRILSFPSLSLFILLSFFFLKKKKESPFLCLCTSVL